MDDIDKKKAMLRRADEIAFGVKHEDDHRIKTESMRGVESPEAKVKVDDIFLPENFESIEEPDAETKKKVKIYVRKLVDDLLDDPERMKQLADKCFQLYDQFFGKE